MAVSIALVLCSAAGTVTRGQNPLPAVDPAKPPAAPARPTVSFDFERKGLPVPKYHLTIHGDGATVYEGDEVEVTNKYGTPVTLPPHPFQSPVSISPATSGHIFELARKLNHFNVACASKAKNIADSGTKTLTYTGPDGTGACTYNYSENKDVEALTEIIQGITETMDQGRKLDHLHRYDRLGLDAAITFLAQEVTDGHALELGTIAASLHSIAADGEVMERVRTRANKLLTLVPVGSNSHP